MNPASYSLVSTSDLYYDGRVSVILVYKFLPFAPKYTSQTYGQRTFIQYNNIQYTDIALQS